MADLILKGQVKEDGSFEIKLNEITQKKLFGQVTQSLEKTAKAGDPKLQKLVKDLGDAIKKGGIDDNRDLKKLLGLVSGKERFAQRRENLLGRDVGSMGLFGGIARGLGVLKDVGVDLARTLSRVDLEYKDASDFLSNYAKEIPIVGSYIKGGMDILSDFVQSSLDTFRNLSQVGGSFNNNMMRMREAALTANLTLDEFGRIVSSNSQTLAAFEGSVTKGAQRFSDITRIIRRDFAESIFRLGISAEELSELTLSTLEVFRRNGTLQGATNLELASSTTDLIKQFDLLSRLTGKSRGESARQILALQNENNFRAFLATDLKNASKPVKNALGLFVNVLSDALPGFKGGILNIIAAGTATNEFGAELTGVAGPLVETLQKVRDEALRGSLNFRSVAGFLKEAQGTLSLSRDQFIDLAKLVEGTGAVGRFIGEISNIEDFLNRTLDPDFIEREQKAQDSLTKGMAELNNIFRRLSTEIGLRLLQSSTFKRLTDMLGGIIKNFSRALDQLTPYIDKVVESIDLFINDLFSKEGRDRIATSFEILTKRVELLFLQAFDKIPFVNNTREITETRANIERLRGKESVMLEQSRIRSRLSQISGLLDDEQQIKLGRNPLDEIQKAQLLKERSELEYAKEKQPTFADVRAVKLMDQVFAGLSKYLNTDDGNLPLVSRRLIGGQTAGQQVVEGLKNQRLQITKAIGPGGEEVLSEALANKSVREMLATQYQLNKNQLQTLEKIANILNNVDKNTGDGAKSTTELNDKIKSTSPGQMLYDFGG